MEQMLYTVKEVAKILKCNPNTASMLRRKGLLPFLKLGQYKCRREALEEFLKRCEGHELTDDYRLVPLPEFENIQRNRMQQDDAAGQAAAEGEQAAVCAMRQEDGQAWGRGM